MTELRTWLLTVGLLSAAFPALADIEMGVFPRRSVAATYQAFRPLAEKLSGELGEPVNLVVSKDFREFWSSVADKRFDLVHYNQYHYVKSHKEFGYRVIAANEEFGDSTIAGALIVRTDSGIESVADLRGKTILFGGGRLAMGSYIAPTAVLKKAGLVEGRDYAARFAKNPPGAVMGAYHKAADAAGAGSVVIKLGAVTKKIDAAQVKNLAVSEPFTHLPWAVKEDMPQQKAEMIQKIMSRLDQSPEGESILKAAKVTGFVVVTDGDYDKVREIAAFALDQSN